jgi:hypothetical protein
MPGYWDDVRQLRNEMRAARGAPPLPERRHKAGRDQPQQQPSWDETPAWDETPDGDAGENSGCAEAQAAVQDGELAEARRLLAEMADYAEQLESRVIELIAGAEPMAKALLLPGVKPFLTNKFHPDKYPEADERQRALLTEALKTINTAYAIAGKLQTSESSASPASS